jgi:DNA processing protein
VKPSTAFLRRPIERLTQSCAEYPQELLRIAAHVRGFDAPCELQYIGTLPEFAPAAPCVAIVGARACSLHGRQIAGRLAAGLAAAGVVVVSGAARGIDQAAMQGALDAGGTVVAILGSGLRRPYPPDAFGMLEQIAAQGGAALSEFPAAMPPLRHHFPKRNRLLAAFCQAIVVVEAGTRSGSMNTVRWGLDLGRELAAVPGLAGAPSTAGPHRMLREGAALVETAADVLRLLGFEHQVEADGSLGRVPKTEHACAPILRALAGLDMPFDELLVQTRMETTELQAALGELELLGIVQRREGGAYHRCTSP